MARHPVLRGAEGKGRPWTLKQVQGDEVRRLTVACDCDVSRLRSTRTEQGTWILHQFALLATVTGAFGHWPRIAGEYIASTRVCGMLKRPEPFSRTTYSTAWVPAGIQPK
jgi:hypothetical protein